jgi:hypothetical protein
MSADHSPIAAVKHNVGVRGRAQAVSQPRRQLRVVRAVLQQAARHDVLGREGADADRVLTDGCDGAVNTLLTFERFTSARRRRASVRAARASATDQASLVCQRLPASFWQTCSRQCGLIRPASARAAHIHLALG